MSDCANVEMRERLPELAAGALDPATRARVEAHVAACADCAAELDTLRAVRAAFGKAPAVDVKRVLAALPKPPVGTVVGIRSRPFRRWVDWRIAAALTVITVGGLSVVVTQRIGQSRREDAGIDQQAQDSTMVVATTPPRTTDSAEGGSPRPPRPQPHAARLEKAQLSFGGGVDGLDRATIEALMGALDEIDRAPVAPSVEPDRAPLLPVINEGTR